MITHTITWLELLWTIVSAIGLIFTGAILNRVMGDLNLVKRADINGLRKYAAKTSVVTFIGGTVTQLAFVILGVVAMTQPSSADNITPLQYVTGLILTVASTIATIFAAIIYNRRVKLVKMIQEKE